MTKEQILNYLRTTPANTNPAVVEGMLDQMSGSDDISKFVTLFKTYATANDDQTNFEYSPVNVEEIQNALSNEKGMILLLDLKEVGLSDKPVIYNFFRQDTGYLFFSNKDDADNRLQISISDGAVSEYDPLA